MIAKRKFFFYSLLACTIASFLYAFFLWNKGHRDPKTEIGIQISSDSLFAAYQQDEQSANQRFLDKMLVVTGNIASVSLNQDGKTVVLLQTGDPIFGVRCTMDQESAVLKPGNTVSIKGICTGFLTDVVLIQCIRMRLNQ